MSRVRISLHGKPRDHYCIFKKCKRAGCASDDAFKYAEIKQHLAINDLKRFGVQTLLVDEYSDITALLKQIENRFQRKTALISGSTHEYFDTYYPKHAELKPLFAVLGDASDSRCLIDTVVEIINKAKGR